MLKLVTAAEAYSPAITRVIQAIINPFYSTPKPTTNLISMTTPHVPLMKFNSITTTRSFSSSNNSETQDFHDRVKKMLDRAEEAASQLEALHKKYKQIKESDLPAIVEVSKMHTWYPHLAEGYEGTFEVEEDENNRYLRINMPGVEQKGLRMWLDKGNNELHVKGEGAGFRDDVMKEDHPWNYSGSFCFDPEVYQLDKARGLINNGVLRIFIPKIIKPQEC